MLQEIKLFLFILSIIFVLKVTLEFVIKLTQDNPEPMSLNKVEQTLLLFALSYTLTYILI